MTGPQMWATLFEMSINNEANWIDQSLESMSRDELVETLKEGERIWANTPGLEVYPAAELDPVQIDDLSMAELKGAIRDALLAVTPRPTAPRLMVNLRNQDTFTWISEGWVGRDDVADLFDRAHAAIDAGANVAECIELLKQAGFAVVTVDEEWQQ
jgi:hypothetical protein